jgi:hypothetical protein
MPGLRLDDLDRDGALADAFDGLHGRTHFVVYTTSTRGPRFTG